MATTLQGTTVLVTGAAGGLGKAIATAYLDAGASVAICDVNEARLDHARSELESTGRFLALKTDVTDEAAMTKLVDDVVARFGRLDILVSNAGIMDSFDPVGSTAKELWDRIIGVNLTGSFLAFKAAVNAMEKQDPPGGTIIQIGSSSTWHGMSAGVAYTASKHGVAALVKSTAGFYGGKGIFAVGLLLGGMADTNIMQDFGGFEKVNVAAFSQSVSARFTPDMAVPLRDVAKYCVFLADRDIAAASNGSLITFNKNFPGV
ncbi:NAD(P)-binding protein [Hypoxylon sp. NC1633]|nr:NAD(P)-binding protein [Hypoxylon sp. NC1633]